MRRMVIYLALLLMATVQAAAQQVVLNKQRHFKKAVPAGNYSGVTWLGGDRYAVCNDKSATAGFLLMTICLDSITGKIEDVRADSFMTSNLPNRDEEGICYVAPTNTLFLSGESDGQIVESALDGRLTGRKLNIPDVFGVSHGNKGFEALTYNAKTHRFWTTTENTLKADGEQPSIRKKIANRLRLQSFGDDLQPKEQYWYVTDGSPRRRTGDRIGTGGEKEGKGHRQFRSRKALRGEPAAATAWRHIEETTAHGVPHPHQPVETQLCQLRGHLCRAETGRRAAGAVAGGRLAKSV